MRIPTFNKKYIPIESTVYEIEAEKGFNKMKLAAPVNEGWLYNRDRYAIKLFASYDKEDDGSLTFGDRTMIPLACVKKIVKIK